MIKYKTSFLKFRGRFSLIDFSFALSFTTPKGSCILLPDFLSSKRILKDIQSFTLFIYFLFTLEFIRFICKLFVSNSLKSLDFFPLTSLFSVRFFLQHYQCFLSFFFLVFVGLVLMTNILATSTVHLFQFLFASQQATTQNVNFLLGIDILHKQLQKPSHFLHRNCLFYGSILEKDLNRYIDTIMHSF